MAKDYCSSYSSSALRIVVFVVFLLLHTLRGSSGAVSHGHDGSSTRSLLGAARSQIPDCTQLGSESQCSQNRRCRWCRSESLDDTCFSRQEAWRLPQQVFSCD
ncbi:hypothetical protein CJ030_MR2G000224 [Morella rubra]|uniref:Uncharacterized protein n=1 Tax=Morella rubra TaxID=262757 RepID=A0A6A1W8L1_9ROSI|nr:hypothetical protein CJ030_MR2G000224 [Morella rubra]